MTSSGGDAALSQKLSPLAVDQCKGVADDVARGTAVASVRSPGVTMLGMTHVRADVAVTGHDALLVGRLWDVDPATGHQRLVDRGVVRLRSRKLVSFDLNGNAYKFARGHQIKLELLGRDSPTYRAANGDVQRDGAASCGWRCRRASDSRALSSPAVAGARRRAHLHRREHDADPRQRRQRDVHPHDLGRQVELELHDADDALRGQQQADARQPRRAARGRPRAGAPATTWRRRARRARRRARRGGR